VSEHAAHAPALSPDAGFFERHHFLLRRLHSLSGIVPVGVFLIEHLFTVSAILLGPEFYQKDINFIWNLPGLVMLEVVGIWLPLAFHAGLGVAYTFGGTKWNPVRYPYQDNWRYVWQRITGMIALVYIFFHISTTRWHWSYFGWYTPFDPTRATATTVDALQAYWWVPVFYLVGALATVYHFANGLWTAAITWGLTVSVAAQRRWGYVCLALGAVLALLAVASILKFSTMAQPPAPEAHTATVAMRQ